MKQNRTLFLLSAFALLFMVSCSASSLSSQQNSQTSITQTQQGIHVGLNIYDPKVQTEQTVTQNGMIVNIMSPNLSLPLKSPAVIHGKVSGVYFSEGVFPVVLADAKGKEIVRTLAHADGEWMTQDFVPFTVELNFQKNGNNSAKLIFERDNPSGLPENGASQSFDVSLE